MTEVDLTFLDLPPPEVFKHIPEARPPSVASMEHLEPQQKVIDPNDHIAQVEARSQLQAPITHDPLIEQYPVGPNLRSPNQKSHKDIPKEIMAVYHQLGGTEWLFLMAKAYPKEFLSMIKPLIPKDISINADFKGINLAIIDTFTTPDELLTAEEQDSVVDATFKIVGDNAEPDIKPGPG